MGERGVDPYLTFDQVRACHRLYMAGQSLRSIARQIHPRTRYASVASCANALHQQFILLGLPRRERAEATAAANRARATGLSRRELKIRRGDILGRPLCAGVRQQYPRKGAPCGARALAGSKFCFAHDPARADERDAILRRAREAA
ncbi:hypothetical protein [Miltoncostaea oceani]|uniref:hypothetical protein n=1 Tax=Miltoncostaea oceani TaxID=2843216 RepID=UPI001C3D69B4|nr:hypothetical protein [Miltoncostaea oceani]